MAKRPNAIITGSITEALLQLMGNTAFNKITVTDITKKAGVGRVSFYSNVKSTRFVKDYFADTSALIYALKEYKRVSAIPHGEYALADLLR